MGSMETCGGQMTSSARPERPMPRTPGPCYAPVRYMPNVRVFSRIHPVCYRARINANGETEGGPWLRDLG